MEGKPANLVPKEAGHVTSRRGNQRRADGPEGGKRKHIDTSGLQHHIPRLYTHGNFIALPHAQISSRSYQYVLVVITWLPVH